MSLIFGQKMITGLDQADTPPTNRGVLSTRAPQAAIIIDWLAFTLPNTPATWLAIEQRFGPLDQTETRVYGYSISAPVLGSGRIFWSDDRPDMGVHCRLPSSALAEYDLSVWSLLAWVIGSEGSITRLDVAYDDYDGNIDLDVMLHHWQAGEVVSRYRTVRQWYEPSPQGVDNPRLTGIAFGSRQSDSYLRVYDKRIERQAAGQTDIHEHWVRVELELKGDKATAVVTTLVGMTDTEARSGYLAGLLVGLFDVVLSPGTDSNKSRWPRVCWWSAFIGAVSKIYVGLPKLDRTIEQVKSWFSASIAPMAAVILLSADQAGQTGYEWLMAAIVAGERRFKTRHKILAGIAT